MRDFTRGMLARSKAGHDTGKLYVLMEADNEFVWLCDGKNRTLDRLKKKRRKHIQIIYQIPCNLGNLLEEGGEIRDEHIRKAIREYERQRDCSNQQEV